MRGRKEPGLDRKLPAYSLNAARTLREPDVAETAAEQSTLAESLWRHPDLAEACVDHSGIHPFAVVHAPDFVAPTHQRGSS